MLSHIKRLVPRPIKQIYHRLKNPDHLQPEKVMLVDLALALTGARSLADLGGNWNVNGGYTFHALDRYHLGRAVIADFSFSPRLRKRKAKYPQLELVGGNFALRETAERVGPVDAALLFDVLLHQVRPDWDETLRNWAPYAKHFVVYNQQFAGPRTVRLVDLPREEYFRHVPADASMPNFKELFECPDERHPFYADGRPNRDMHAVWQWGITDEDLRRVMRSLGFAEAHYKNCGAWPGVEGIENHAFVFSRQR